MTSLERMMAAIRGEPFDRYPVVNPYPGWSMMPHWPELAGLTFLHVDVGSDEQRLRCHRAFHETLGMDLMPIPWGPTGQDQRYRIETGDGACPGTWTETPFPLFRVEIATGKRIRVDQYPIDPPVTKPGFTSAREVEALPPPATADQIVGGRGMARKVVAEFGGRVFLMMGETSPFAKCFYKQGFDALYQALLDDPALLHALLERHTEELVQTAKAMKRLGVHGMRVNEWPAGAELISEKHYLEFVFPYTQRVFRAMREQGLVTILEYLGWVEPRLKHIARLEVDCLQTESSMKGYRNDVGEMRKVLGEKVCIFGNSPILRVIEEGDEAVWRQDAVEQARGVGRQRRYAICAGSPTTWNTGPARLRRFGEFMREVLAGLVPPLKP